MKIHFSVDTPATVATVATPNPQTLANLAKRLYETAKARQDTVPPQPAPAPEPKSSIARCGDCKHSILPPATEPVYGWRLCGLGLPGNFARAAHRCERWESRP